MEITLQWLAGFFDGEGHVGFSWTSKPNKYPYPRCTITNTHRPTLAAIQKKFGGSLGIQRKSGKGGRQCYTLAWSCRKAMEFMKLLSPYLVVKKEQVDLVLTNWESHTNGKRLTEFEIEARAQIISQVSEMKRVEYLQ